jgi:Na+/proline symporter
MNSMATTLVTDFMRPFHVCKTESNYLRAARGLTMFTGMLGTLIGLIFIDPRITSLFDAFIKIVGLFMGVLCGLFMLGVLTRRANAAGAMTGALAGACLMSWLYLATSVNGYLYIPLGIAACMIVGYVASFFWCSNRDLTGLTLHTLETREGMRR